MIEIPLRDEGEFAVSQAMIDEWQQLYPSVNILQALKNIRGWNSANPSKRKSGHFILQHINHWLATEMPIRQRILCESQRVLIWLRITLKWLKPGFKVKYLAMRCSMKENEKSNFAKMLTAVGELYGKKVSLILLSLYWSALERFNFADIRQAIAHHVNNPDVGQFCQTRRYCAFFGRK